MKENISIDIIEAMIERYLADNNDSEAACSLKQAAMMSEEYRLYIQKRLEMGFSVAIASATDEFDKEKAYARFLARTNGNGRHGKGFNAKAWRRIGIAAAIAFAVIMSWTGYKYATMNNDKELANICITTPNGSKTMISMPDGTKIWLNAGSKISYSKGFGETERNITLAGEACFDVAKNKELPFVVNSKSARLKVLGTKFTFRAYPEEKELTVELIRGHVDIASNKTGKHIDMLPNEQTVVDNKTGNMTKKKIDASRSDSWTRGELLFDEMPLKQIAMNLERAYAVKIKVNDNIANKHFYGSFNSSGMSIDEVLKTMSETQRMKYSRTSSGEYYIY